MFVHPSSKGRREHRIRFDVEVREIGDDGEHPGAREAERFELLTVELRIAERELAPADVRAQLAAAEITAPDQLVVHAQEVMGGRDVVVDEDHLRGRGIRDPRRLRPDRKVMDEKIVGSDRVFQLAIVARQRLELRVRGLDEDVGRMAGRQQRALDAQHLVADRVAVAQRREDLVDLCHRRPWGLAAASLVRALRPVRDPCLVRASDFVRSWFVRSWFGRA